MTKLLHPCDFIRADDEERLVALFRNVLAQPISRRSEPIQPPAPERVWYPEAPGKSQLPLGVIVRRHPEFTYGFEDLPVTKVRQAYRSWSRGRVGKFKSHKMGRTARARADLEFDHHMLREFQPHVLAVLEHPVRLRYTSPSGKTAHHIPDAFVRCGIADGDGFLDEFDEIKWEKDAAIPENEHKWDAIGRTFASLGYIYRVLTERDLRRQPRYQNLLDLFRRRHVRPPCESILAALRAALEAAGGAVSRCDLPTLVPELVPKQIDLLILRGVLTIDIDRRLNGDTLVSWASPLATPGTILAHCEH